MVRGLTIAVLVILLAGSAVACHDRIPVAPASSETSDQSGVGRTQSRGATGTEATSGRARDQAVAALSRWQGSLRGVVLQLELDVRTAEEIAKISARAHRDLLTGRDWIDFATLEATGSALAFQLLVTNEDVHLSLDGIEWEQVAAQELGWVTNLERLLQLEELADSERAAPLLDCLDSTIGSVSELNWEGRPAWDLLCAGDTGTPEPDSELSALVNVIATQFRDPNRPKDGDEEEGELEEDSEQAVSTYAHLRLIVDRESGALLRLELRMGNRYQQQPDIYIDYSAVLISYNEPMEFPDPRSVLRN